METKELNLCELLKGHEGETFYSSLTQGNITLKKVHKMLVFEEHLISLDDKGAFYPNGECMVFPSKEQRDWNKWADEQKPKVPKIWEDITHCNVEIWQAISHLDYGAVEPVVKSALALLKIYQLIEVGYAGNVTDEEWDDNSIEKYCIAYDIDNKKFVYTDSKAVGKQPIAFHTEKQAIEFMSYSENVQLIKDFYMYESEK